jgi:hypothetical protein
VGEADLAGLQVDHLLDGRIAVAVRLAVTGRKD